MELCRSPWKQSTNQKPCTVVTMVTSCLPVDMKGEHVDPMECGMEHRQSVRVSVGWNITNLSG